MKEGRLPGWRREFMVATVVFAVVLTACLLGIFTRPLGFLAAFWPANAILLGLFVRFPRLASAVGWIAATAGYFTADLLTGGTLARTAWLTAANLAGVVTGVLLFARLGADDRAMRRPLSVGYLLGILACASGAAAVIGAGAAPVFFGRDLLAGAAFWFTTELVNGIIVLPVILAAPEAPVSLSLRLQRAGDKHIAIAKAAPIATLAASLFIGSFVGGVGALALPSPALLWCALAYPLFPAVLLAMLVSVWNLITVSLGLAGQHIAQIDETTMSDRLGIMLLTLGPLTVASINTARAELMRKLAHRATYDALTGALARAAFVTRAESIIATATDPLAVLVLDIDHFKRINDTYGHAAGDKALVGFADVVASSLRTKDLFGRIGGEEFAILLPQTNGEEALNVAERLRSGIEDLRSPLPNGQTLRFTVSVGLIHLASPSGATIENLLKAADDALYRAKGTGRNRVVGAQSAS